MDIGLYIRVLWRFRVIVAVGLALAIGLSFLSVFRVSPTSPHVAYRKQVLWQSKAVLFVSSAGYPWRPAGTTASVDPAGFAVIASGFATSDPVRSILWREEPVQEVVRAVPENDGDGHFLPFVDITGISTSPAAAITLATRAAKALQSYVAAQQTAHGVAPKQGVSLQLVSAANKATIAAPRSKTLPVMIFALILALTVATAFVLENLRPSPGTVAAEAAVERLAA